MTDREILLQIGKESGSKCRITDDVDRWEEWNQCIREGIMAFGEDGRVTRLSFCGDDIPLLPECVGLLSALIALEISDTPIRELPESIGNLSALEILDIYRTYITELPETIGKLSALKRLLLRELALEYLPESIGNCLALEYLDISGTNQICNETLLSE